MTDFKKTICVDFDGVIHWYRKGWQGGEIYDEPVPGAIEWLNKLMSKEYFEVAIYSSRSKDKELLIKMKDWLKDHGAGSLLSFPTQKPAAWLTIDDRAICFEGEFPSVESINNFKPWNKP